MKRKKEMMYIGKRRGRLNIREGKGEKEKGRE